MTTCTPHIQHHAEAQKLVTVVIAQAQGHIVPQGHLGHVQILSNQSSAALELGTGQYIVA